MTRKKAINGKDENELENIRCELAIHELVLNFSYRRFYLMFRYIRVRSLGVCLNIVLEFVTFAIIYTS